MSTSEIIGAGHRDTLVVELIAETPIGTTEASEASVQQYLSEVAGLINLRILQPPRHHLSPLYGLSGYVPLEQSSAVHLYAWDHEDCEHRPFVSVDLATPAPLLAPELVVDHARHFFGAQAQEVVWKRQQDLLTATWRELAPHIVRQRLALTGRPKQQGLSRTALLEYLDELPGVLDMVDLSGPVVLDADALEKVQPSSRAVASEPPENITFWGHWETSGYIGSLQRDLFAIDIYTCKEFSPETAQRLTRSKLGLREITGRSF